MKKQLLLPFLILLLGLSASAQKVKLSTEGKNLRKHVAYLASDELEGRRTGEKGATFAAGYVSNMFQRYKLDAGYTNENGVTSYLQPFEYVSGVEFGPDTSMSFGGSMIQKGIDWVPFILTQSAELSSTEVIFALHGISSERLGHDDYQGLDVKGRIAAVFSGTPDGGNPRSPFAAFDIRAKANVAKEKGAIALIVIADAEELAQDRQAKFPFSQTLGETAVPVVIVSRKVGTAIMNLGATEDIAKIEKWIESKPDNAKIHFAGLKTTTAGLRIDVQKQKTQAYNVVGIIPGRDKVLKGEAIVIGAHYDHLGRGGEGSLASNSKEIHHGADDNASGTAALMDLARRFRKEKENRRTLIFIAFGGEEEGLLGSKAYIDNPAFPIENTVAMFNMDMVGRLNANKLTVGGIGSAESFNDLVVNTNRRVPDVYAPKKNRSSFAAAEEIDLFDLQLNQDGLGPSDHASFYLAKVPVLFFFTGTHADYHKPSDTSDKINYDGLERIADFVSDLIRKVDSNATRPVFKAAQASTSEAGRRGFNVSLGTIPGYGDSDNTGLVLEGVRDDSAADKAGIKGGDKIISIAGKEIRNISDYVFMLGELTAGKEYEVIVMRGTEKLTLKIVPDPR